APPILEIPLPILLQDNPNGSVRRVWTNERRHTRWLAQALITVWPIVSCLVGQAAPNVKECLSPHRSVWSKNEANVRVTGFSLELDPSVCITQVVHIVGVSIWVVLYVC